MFAGHRQMTSSTLTCQPMTDFAPVETTTMNRPTRSTVLVFGGKKVVRVDSGASGTESLVPLTNCLN